MPGQQPVKPDDLTQLPVNLNTAQRRMLFGPLKPLFNATRDGADGLHQCAEVLTVKLNLYRSNFSAERSVRRWPKDTNTWCRTFVWFGSNARYVTQAHSSVLICESI
jgi:hypothetical protein